MAAYNKFQDFTEQLCKAKHDFSTHTFKVMLTNAAPIATNTVKTDITDITAGFGYTAGGNNATASITETTGTATVAAVDVVWTAAGGSIGPFRYVVLYNDTTASPVKPLVAWWDYGSSITLADTETFTADFGSNSILTLV